MLIRRETICTRTIGNKKFPDVSKSCQVTWPSYLTFDVMLLCSGCVDQRGGGDMPEGM